MSSSIRSPSIAAYRSNKYDKKTAEFRNEITPITPPSAQPTLREQACPSSNTLTYENHLPILEFSPGQFSNACKRLGLSGSGEIYILVD